MVSSKNKDNSIVIDGIVTKVLPSANFEVEVAGGRVVKAHISGRMRMHFVKLLLRDRVSIELNLYDFSRGRIVFRLRSLLEEW
jgi:translation initiation factor IF-1